MDESLRETFLDSRSRAGDSRSLKVADSSLYHRYISLCRLSVGFDWIDPAARSARSLGLLPEPLGFVGAAGSVTGAVRMSSCAGQPAIVDDQILFPDGTAVEPAFQDLAHAGSVAGLRR